MAQLTVAGYDALEAAIRDGIRITVRRRGTDFVVIPMRLLLRGRREAIEARPPTTGQPLTLWGDEADSIEVVRWAPRRRTTASSPYSPTSRASATDARATIRAAPAHSSNCAIRRTARSCGAAGCKTDRKST